jgi:hypothetical protein
MLLRDVLFFSAPCSADLRRAVLCGAASRRAVLRRAVRCCFAPCCAAPRQELLKLRCGVACRAVLLCAVLSYAVAC